MANVTLNSKIQIRNDTAANWTTSNPVLLKGELGIEIDTRKYKIGDGVINWTTLKYASGGGVEIKESDPISTDTGYEIGTLWINSLTNAFFLLIAKSASAIWKKLVSSTDVIAEAAAAQKLKTSRTIGLTGDGTGSASFDGTANATITLVLKNSGVTAGTYTKLTVDAKGIVISAALITEADLPSISHTKITGLGTAATKNVGTAVGNVVEVLAGGKIDESILPALAITEVFEVANQAAMLALICQRGDVAIRSDENKSYILSQTPASTLANWKLLRTPTDLVLSVNGKTGAVVLTTSDISEGTNLYYTAARDTANFNTNFAAKSSAGLTDGATILHSGETFILNGGTASN